MAETPSDWDAATLPEQSGRVFLITGSTAGLGYFAAERLAAAGAHVVMSGRNPNRLATARAALQRRVPGASSESILLDVTKSGSVHSAAATLGARSRLDGVILNAGVIHAPQQREEVEGHELVLQTNVLGHFALAGDLLLSLAKTGRRGPDARMVWLGSISAASFRSRHPDYELYENYDFARVYVQSKFLVQAIAAEADRRLREHGIPVQSVIAHPGYALGGRTVGVAGVNEPSRLKRFRDNLQAVFSQSKQTGADALVRALIDPAVSSGDLVGPKGGLRGATRIFARDARNRITNLSRDPEIGREAWEFCERATRTTWPFARAVG